MRAKRSWASTLALSLSIALGSLALMSATASAGWLVPAETAFAGEKAVAGTGAASELLVSPLGLEVSCTSLIVTGTLTASTKALVRILFSGCSVLGNVFCKVYESKMAKELKEAGSLVAKGKGTIILHGDKHYLLIEEHESAALMTIYFSKLSQGCTLPLETKVTGSTIMELPDALTGQVSHLIKPMLDMEIQLLFREVAGLGTTNNHRMLYGLESAELHGGLMTIALTSGETWAGH